MADYTTECEALLAAFAQGILTVSYRDRSVTYADTDQLVARMTLLGCFGQRTNWRNRGVNPCTSKGLNRCGCGCGCGGCGG